MTRSRHEISPEAQIAWWSALDRSRIKPWLYDYHGDTVGYGLNRQGEDERWWVSGGLAVHVRGFGLGYDLFEHLVSATPSREAWLEVISSNIRAHRLYENLGFVLVDTRDVESIGLVDTMVRRTT